MNPNPLSGKPKTPSSTEHPVAMHAKMWKQVSGMAPGDVTAKTEELAHTVPILGSLAAKQNVTRKDIIKAAADASGIGKVTPSAAIQFLSQMPDDPAQLRPWLKGLYTASLSALVHLKAAQMPQATSPAAPPAAPVTPGQPA